MAEENESVTEKTSPVTEENESGDRGPVTVENASRDRANTPSDRGKRVQWPRKSGPVTEKTSRVTVDLHGVGRWGVWALETSFFRK